MAAYGNSKTDKGGFRKTPQSSVKANSFFSTDYQDGNWQTLTINIYGDKVSFNFLKGKTGDPNKPSSQFITFDYTTICCMLNFIIDPLCRQRELCFNDGSDYPIGVWLTYTLKFTDFETKQDRVAGNFIIKTEVSPSTNKNTVYICYNNGVDEWKVALGKPKIFQHFTLENPQANNVLDPEDALFRQFAGLIRYTVYSWPLLQMMNHQTGIMMNNFNLIKDKLGIESKRFSGKDNGNYTDSNYRSSAPDADDSGSTDVGEYGGDMPF